MQNEAKPTTHKPGHATLTSYVNGFMLSIVLTVAAYLLVVQHTLSNHVLIFSVGALALVQFLVQIFFFLHLGRETRPRWKLLVFGGMLIVVLILVIGSIWIMSNLNYHMTNRQINQYMNRQDGL